MTDLSYTDKDGLNPAEGFTNLFNYHKDGKQDGDGFAHGGYPHIDGETSPYIDTSYKTGDKEDFFDNGNVWVQPSVNPGPGPEPTPGITATLKSVVYTNEIDANNYVTSGTFPTLVKGDNYTVAYNGNTYEVTVDEFAAEGTMIYVGNVGALFRRSEIGAILLQAGMSLPEDNNLPFLIAMSGSIANTIFAFISTSTDQEITLTDENHNSCTVSLDSSVVSQQTSQYYFLDQNFEEFVDTYDVYDGKSQGAIINNNNYEGTWESWESGGDGFKLSLPKDGTQYVRIDLMNAQYNVIKFGSTADYNDDKVVQLIPSDD